MADKFAITQEESFYSWIERDPITCEIVKETKHKYSYELKKYEKEEGKELKAEEKSKEKVEVVATIVTAPTKELKDKRLADIEIAKKDPPFVPSPDPIKPPEEEPKPEPDPIDQPVP